MQIQPRLLKLGVNPQGRDFVVGDIHGCVSALLKQLDEQHQFNPAVDRVICVGDLIDRGPEPTQALALLNEPWFFSVIGNHEHLMVSAFKEHHQEHRDLILQHGGDWVLQQPTELLPIWFAQIEALPLAIELENHKGQRIGVVHADYPLDDWNLFSTLTYEQAERAIWARDKFKQRIEGNIANIDWVIYGHNVTEHELRLGNRFYIDAGVFNNRPYFIKNIDEL